MGFKRPEVQIFSPRPGRRGRLSVRGDFFSPHSSKIPALTPAVRSSLSAQCPLRSFTLPLRTSARPRSLTTFRGRAPRVDDPRDGRASAAIFFYASLFKNPRRGVPPSAPPFPRNVRFAPSLCRYEHPPAPARLPHSAGALRAILHARRKCILDAAFYCFSDFNLLRHSCESSVSPSSLYISARLPYTTARSEAYAAGFLA